MRNLDNDPVYSYNELKRHQKDKLIANDDTAFCRFNINIYEYQKLGNTNTSYCLWIRKRAKCNFVFW